MTTNPRSLTPRPIARALTAALALAVLAALSLSSAAGARTAAARTGASRAAASRAGASRTAGSRTGASPAHSASSFLTGIGDEHPQMFANPLYQQLHTRIVRYIAPYDAAVHPWFLQQAYAWISAAEADHQQVLVAFYHSEYTPTKLPSVAVYQHDVQKFIRYFPNVHQYQAYDEANRGNVYRSFSSPSASLDARYYQALLRVCHGCNVVGLDVLDQADIYPTLEYIKEFKREIYRLKTIMPSIWGLHNYSDVNRFETWRTREISRAMGGQVWLTETGGIVKFGGAFPNYHGSGLARAARALKLMFAIARANPRIKRLYVYDWTGGNANVRFDAGLMDAHERPRPGYQVVCRELHAAHCNVRLSDH